MEHYLIAACIQSRTYYEKINSLLDPAKELSTLGSIFFNEVKTYYNIDVSATAVSLAQIKERIKAKYDKYNEELDIYTSLFPSVISEDNILKDLIDLKKKHIAEKIMYALHKQDASVNDLFQEYQSISSSSPVRIDANVYDNVSLENVLEQSFKENLLPLYPKQLSSLLGGGLPRQSQIGIFARPDVGKSTVAVNIAGGALLNGYKVLYIGNEDTESRMIARIVSRLIDVPYTEIISNPTKYTDLARKKGYSNLVFVSAHPGTIKDIYSLVELYSPDILIIDQIKNIHVNKGSPTENLEEAAKETRAIAKKYNLVSVIITQAGESAANKLILEMEDVYNSNTGFQGALDLLIGIGQTEQLKEKGHIMLSFPKNKLSAPIGAFSCKIDYLTNKLLTHG